MSKTAQKQNNKNSMETFFKVLRFIGKYPSDRGWCRADYFSGRDRRDLPPDLWEKGGGSPQIPQIPYFFRKPWQLYGQLGGKCR